MLATEAQGARDFRIGDRVRIKNPHHLQPIQGTVTKITKERITVTSYSGTEVSRAPNNLELLEYPNDERVEITKTQLARLATARAAAHNELTTAVDSYEPGSAMRMAELDHAIEEANNEAFRAHAFN